MRRAPPFAAVLAAAAGLLLADAASAQSARYLSWPGRAEATPPQDRVAPEPAAARRDLRRSNRVIPHGGVAAPPPAPRGLTPAPGPARRSLTPANAWLQPAAPGPEAIPQPATVMSQPPSPPPPAPPPRPGPEYLPDQGGRGQPAPAEVVYATPAPAAGPSAAPADPMAPRRDAPVFQMQRTAPSPAPESRPAPPPSEVAAAVPVDAPAAPRRVAEVVNSGERAPRQGARYYSVHRQNGREPDPLVMPESTYIDALVVSMDETPASQDLAAPEPGPTLVRDRNGNMRAAPAPSDGDHQ